MKISIERLRWSWRRSLLVMLTVGLSVGASQATAEKIVLATGADPCFGVFYVPHEIGAFKEAGLETELVTGAIADMTAWLLATISRTWSR
jgi:ABC-type nitrate/sulfonate/bicarbonate transport system substrate-binding protein